MKFNEQQIDSVTELLKSIAHPIRMKILCFLMEGEKNVGEIEQQFGSTISNISQHLTVLRKANIIERRKEANFMFYSLKDNNMFKLMETLKNNFC
ncbi:MAG: winged helix-turn-helix transcriptional regulator [Spirochaetes bacterium]|nr:winged helix-turn-helix transcriptional regulator [Spirochaetota bacterium]